MGNEVSVSQVQTEKTPNKLGIGLKRSSSMKEGVTKAEYNNQQKNGKLRLSATVKRSNTFTSTGFKRPIIFQNPDNSTKAVKSIMKTNKNLANTVEKNNNRIAKTRESQIIKNNINKGKDDLLKTNLQTHHKKDNELVVFKSRFFVNKNVMRKDNFDSSQLSDTKIFKEDQQKRQIMEENNGTENMISPKNISCFEGKQLKYSSGHSQLKATIKEMSQETYLNTKETGFKEQKSFTDLESLQEKHLDVKEKKVSEAKDEKKRAISRRKNKYVRRSQSMKSYHELLPKLLSGEGLDPLANFDELAGGVNKDEALAIEIRKAKLGPRRVSDTCLVKEHHVSKSERYTKMLKELREKAVSEMRPLSPYAIDLFDKKEKKEDRKFKFEKKRDYFDAWLKDQNERINNLERACKEDNEFAKIRKSFRERTIKMPPKNLLPPRPHSVKLPRRQFNQKHLFKSFDTSDSEDEGAAVRNKDCFSFNGSMDDVLTDTSNKDYSLSVESKLENDSIKHGKCTLKDNTETYVNNFCDISNKNINNVENCDSILLDKTNTKLIIEKISKNNCKPISKSISVEEKSISTERKLYDEKKFETEALENLHGGSIDRKEQKSVRYFSASSERIFKNEISFVYNHKSEEHISDHNNNPKFLTGSLNSREKNSTGSVKNIVSKLNHNIYSTKIKITSRSSYPNIAIKPRNEIFLKKETKAYSQSANSLCKGKSMHNVAVVKPLQLYIQEDSNNVLCYK